jgi:hypothetical protein
MAKLLTDLSDCTESLIAEDRVVVMLVPSNPPALGNSDVTMCRARSMKAVELALIAPPSAWTKLVIILDRPYENYTSRQLKEEIAKGPQNDTPVLSPKELIFLSADQS